MTAKNPNGEMTRTHILLLIASCLMAWGVMGMLNAYGIFFTPMGEVLGVGRASVTVHYSLRMLATGFTAPLVAMLIRKKVSHRLTMPIGMILFVITSFLITRAKSVILVDILAVFAGFGLSLISFMLITMILGNWFHKNLGTFSGIAIAFSGIGSAIASPVFTKILNAVGYQTAYILYAIITVLFVVPILFFPFEPETIGLKPYGEGSTAPEKAGKKTRDTAYLDLPFKPLSMIAILLFAITLLIVGTTSLNSHLPSLAIANGFTAETGALLLSASMIGNLVSKLALGVIIDRWGVLKGFMLIIVITMGGFALILFSRGSTLPLLAGGFLYGTIFSLGSLGLSILARYLYGNNQYYYVYSLMTLMTSIGSAAFVTIIGALYDLTGSYSAPVIMGLVIGVIILAVIIFMMAYISKKKKENAQ